MSQRCLRKNCKPSDFKASIRLEELTFNQVVRGSNPRTLRLEKVAEAVCLEAFATFLLISKVVDCIRLNRPDFSVILGIRFLECPW